jgi:hypothetical protein
MSPERFVWRYVLRRGVLDPIVPLRLSNAGRTTPVIWGLLDSGSDRVVVPRWVADGLSVELEPLSMGIMTVSGSARASVGRMDLVIGLGHGVMKFRDIAVIVPEAKQVPVLIGRNPVFRTFDVLFQERVGQVTLTRECGSHGLSVVD